MWPFTSHKYPYTNFHELNADWIIETLKDIKTHVDETLASVSHFAQRLEDAEADAASALQAVGALNQSVNTSLDEIRTAVDGVENDVAEINNKLTPLHYYYGHTFLITIEVLADNTYSLNPDADVIKSSIDSWPGVQPIVQLIDRRAPASYYYYGMLPYTHKSSNGHITFELPTDEYTYTLVIYQTGSTVHYNITKASAVDTAALEARLREVESDFNNIGEILTPIIFDVTYDSTGAITGATTQALYDDVYEAITSHNADSARPIIARFNPANGPYGVAIELTGWTTLDTVYLYGYVGLNGDSSSIALTVEMDEFGVINVQLVDNL